MFSLEGKSALITGAATGIGQAIAVALAAAGANVAISDRDLDRLADTAALVGGKGVRVEKTAIDIRHLDQINRGVAAVERAFGKVDILVNNAGINRPMPGLDVTLENWEDHFNTNVRGGFFMAQAVVKRMIERKWG